MSKSTKSAGSTSKPAAAKKPSAKPAAKPAAKGPAPLEILDVNFQVDPLDEPTFFMTVGVISIKKKPVAKLTVSTSPDKPQKAAKGESSAEAQSDSSSDEATAQTAEAAESAPAAQTQPSSDASAAAVTGTETAQHFIHELIGRKFTSHAFDAGRFTLYEQMASGYDTNRGIYLRRTVPQSAIAGFPRESTYQLAPRPEVPDSVNAYEILLKQLGSRQMAVIGNMWWKHGWAPVALVSSKSAITVADGETTVAPGDRKPFIALVQFPSLDEMSGYHAVTVPDTESNEQDPEDVEMLDQVLSEMRADAPTVDDLTNPLLQFLKDEVANNRRRNKVPVAGSKHVNLRTTLRALLDSRKVRKPR